MSFIFGMSWRFYFMSWYVWRSLPRTDRNYINLFFFFYNFECWSNLDSIPSLRNGNSLIFFWLARFQIKITADLKMATAIAEWLILCTAIPKTRVQGLFWMHFHPLLLNLIALNKCNTIRFTELKKGILLNWR